MNRRTFLRAFTGSAAVLAAVPALPMVVSKLEPGGSIAIPAIPEKTSVMGDEPFDPQGLLEDLAADCGAFIEGRVGNRVASLSGVAISGDTITTPDGLVVMDKHMEATALLRDYRHLMNPALRKMYLLPACIALCDAAERHERIAMATLPPHDQGNRGVVCNLPRQGVRAGGYGLLPEDAEPTGHTGYAVRNQFENARRRAPRSPVPTADSISQQISRANDTTPTERAAGFGEETRTYPDIPDHHRRP